MSGKKQFVKGDRVRLTRDQAGHKKGQAGTFDEYIDDMTARVHLSGEKWSDVSADALEREDSDPKPK